MKLKEKAAQLKIDIPALFLSLKSKKTPIIAKVFAGLVVVYALSPIDFIPDFIPVLGYLDDLIILPALISLTIRFIPSALFEQFRDEAKYLWKDGKPKKWYFAIPIMVFWLLILGLFIKYICF